MGQALQAHQNPQVEGVESRGPNRFQRNNPPILKGRYDPEGVKVWLQEIETIFRVMACVDAHKVLYGTHMLLEEVGC